MAKKEQTPDGRAIKLKMRQAKFVNYNQKPEASGKQLVPRCDVSLEFTLKPAELDVLFDVEGGARDHFWDAKGMPRAREVDGPFPINLVAIGDAKIAPVRAGEADEFDDAKLKHITLELVPEAEALVRCQLRFDPTGSCELFLRLQCARLCRFAFDGAALIETKPEDGEEKSPQADIEDGDADES